MREIECLEDAMDEIDALQSENERLKAALEALCAVQNGPPLIRDTDEWNTAMERASELLPDY